MGTRTARRMYREKINHFCPLIFEFTEDGSELRVHSVCLRLTEILLRREWCGLAHLEPVSQRPCALLKLDFLTNAMHFLYALVRKSSFSKAQGFVKPAPD